jgi:hypothetical protein
LPKRVFQRNCSAIFQFIFPNSNTSKKEKKQETNTSDKVLRRMPPKAGDADFRRRSIERRRKGWRCRFSTPFYRKASKCMAQ